MRKRAVYRIALYGSAWPVLCSQDSLAHAFTDLDQASAFLRIDCGGAEASDELLVDNF